MKTYKQFYKYAKQLAVKWRHSKKMIMEKLFYKGANPKEIETIINRLILENYLDDKKAFELDVFIMEEKRYGYKRIKDYLMSKEYPKELIETYIFNKDIEKDNCYYHFIKSIIKHKNYKYNDIEREKIINYLKRCGFNDKIIYEIIKAGINYENVM